MFFNHPVIKIKFLPLVLVEKNIVCLSRVEITFLPLLDQIWVDYAALDTSTHRLGVKGILIHDLTTFRLVVILDAFCVHSAKLFLFFILNYFYEQYYYEYF